MRLSDQSAALLTLDNLGSPMHAVLISVLEHAVDTSALRDHVAGRISVKPRYRQKLAYVPFNLAPPEWIDDEAFDLDQHVSEVLVGDLSSPEQQMPEFLAFANEPLSRQRPLWRLRQYRDAQGRGVIVHVIHQCVLEGTAIYEEVQPFYDLKPEVEAPTEVSWQPAAAPDGMALAGHAIEHNTREFSERARRLQEVSGGGGDLVRRATESVSKFLTEQIVSAPWNQGWVGMTRAYRAIRVPSADLRRLRRALGGTDNDVVLTLVVEAVARTLAEHNRSDDDRRLRVMCPVRIRREDQKGVRGNRISGMFPVFDVGPKAAVARHGEVRLETESIKQSREPQALQLLAELVPPLPGTPSPDDPTGTNLFISSTVDFTRFNPSNLFRMLSGQAQSFWSFDPRLNGALAAFNFTCATEPGARTRQFFAGAAVDAQFVPPILTANLGLGFVVSTYFDTLTINVVSDPMLMGELDPLVDHMQSVLAELEETAAETGRKANNRT